MTQKMEVKSPTQSYSNLSANFQMFSNPKVNHKILFVIHRVSDYL